MQHLTPAAVAPKQPESRYDKQGGWLSSSSAVYKSKQLSPASSTVMNILLFSVLCFFHSCVYDTFNKVFWKTLKALSDYFLIGGKLLYNVIGFCSAAMQIVIMLYIKPLRTWDFPGGTSGEEPACECRTCKRHGINPGWGASPGEEHGSPLQCSCLENPMNRGAWRAIVHGVAQSQTQPKQLSAQALPHEPPSSRPSNPCRSSQNARLGSLCYIATSHQLSILCSEIGIFMSMLRSQFIPPSPSPDVSTNLFPMSVSPFPSPQVGSPVLLF